ncbi:MAG TPA: hypothetical protein VMU39_21420 [Solirubrobacteraceae bacterium]|nr:hypothetical protein [Solirubrobacteraceae bacterium]
MHATLKRKIAVGTTALAAAAFAGGAYAATSISTNPRQAFLDDVAKRLNVTPQQLKSAVQGAFEDRLQAAVAAGKLTQAQADALKKRIEQNGAVPLGPGPGLLGPRPRPFFKGGPGHGGGRLSAAASYLGLSETQLLKDLQGGKSLAQIASAQGKTASGLKAALTTAIKAKLDKAVAAKMLTAAQEQQMLKNLSSRLDAQINGKGLGTVHGGFGSGGAHGYFRHPGPMRLFPSAPASPPPAQGPVY